MKSIDREATLREVLAEVNLLDVGAALKSVFVMLGCNFVFFGGTALIGEAVWSASASRSTNHLLNWAITAFVVWVALASYTETRSYHEHKFAWYFPKLGFLGSIPLAIYLLSGIWLYRHSQANGDALERSGWLALGCLWALPLVLGVSVLETGHNRLMDKRRAEQDRTGEAADSLQHESSQDFRFP